MGSVRFDAVTVAYEDEPLLPGETTPRPAVDQVTLEASAGELLVLLGPSGCGKTTLLKTVNRLVEPTGGRVLLRDEDVRDVPTTYLRRRIGYAIQATGLFPHMRVAENIAVVPRLLGWPVARVSARVAELLDLVGLPFEYGARWPKQLSGGEAQRVGIARALAADPGYLLMDEPFGALDAIARGRLQSALVSIQTRLQKTILFVTHDVDEALLLADRIAVMRDGRLVQVARPLALLSQPADAFVADLVGARDTMRRLRLMSVADALAATSARATSVGRSAAETAGCTPAVDAPAASSTGASSDAPRASGGANPGATPDAVADAILDPAPDVLHTTTDLGVALSRLLESHAGALPVAGSDVHLSLDDLRGAVQRSRRSSDTTAMV